MELPVACSQSARYHLPWKKLSSILVESSHRRCDYNRNIQLKHKCRLFNFPNKHVIISDEKFQNFRKKNRMLLSEGILLWFFSLVLGKTWAFGISLWTWQFQKINVPTITGEWCRNLSKISCENVVEKTDEIFFPNETIIYPNNGRDHL